MAVLGGTSGMEAASKRSGGWAGVGLLAGGQGRRGWVFGIDTDHRGGVHSWPGRTWGSKKTQLGPRSPACTLWCLYRALAT